MKLIVFGACFDLLVNIH